MPPSVPSCTMALLARVWPARLLMVDVAGIGIPAGRTTRFPAAAGCVTVTLIETAFALGGMSHSPATVTLRMAPAARARAVLRVSIKRQGASAKNGALTTGGGGSG